MGFRFIDYSEEFFAGGPPPRVREGKFVQIRSSSSEFIVLSPRGMSAYHANIVERFFRDYPDVKGSYNRKQDAFRLDAPGWEVVGGGYWRINEDENTLELGGASQAYGTFDAKGLAERLEAALPGYRIVIS